MVHELIKGRLTSANRPQPRRAAKRPMGLHLRLSVFGMLDHPQPVALGS